VNAPADPPEDPHKDGPGHEAAQDAGRPTRQSPTDAGPGERAGPGAAQDAGGRAGPPQADAGSVERAGDAAAEDAGGRTGPPPAEAASDTRAKAAALEAIGRSAGRKRAARQRAGRGMWFGLGMFGLVGWAVAVPTLAGVALGLWLDALLDDPFSWTLALLLAGVTLGCVNAWYWVSRESRHDRR
jgi:ATP synthase protein I